VPENFGGYACVPYTHDHKSIELNDSWKESKNIQNLYFVTATFSQEAKPFFPSHANQYILAKFTNNDVIKDIEKYQQNRTSFVFYTDSEIFERNINGTMNFVSVYYLEYPKSDEDISDLAMVVSKNDRVRMATTNNMLSISSEPSKFTFPYGNNIIILEVSGQKGHQSVNKYCEQTRRDVCRKGITMNNLVGLSILEKLK
jgi:hypothetical protein